MAKKKYENYFKKLGWEGREEYLHKIEAVIARRNARLAKLKEIRAPKEIIQNEMNLIADATEEYRALVSYMGDLAKKVLAAIFGQP